MPDPLIPVQVLQVANDLLPDLRRLTDGRYAVAVGGSIGKGTFDGRSDIDFRYFYDSYIPDEASLQAVKERLNEKIAGWGKRGVIIDGYYARTIADIDAAVQNRLAGGQPPQLVWTIWGYHILTDIANMKIIEDPFGVVETWQSRLSVFPREYKEQVVEEHRRLLAYWRSDYHYRHKTERDDFVFCMGLASRLVNAILRIVYALNETYYPGDGKNLELAAGFDIKPSGLEERVRKILFIQDCEGALCAQREALVNLIDDTLDLIERST